jgi:hypothetical protein
MKGWLASMALVACSAAPVAKTSPPVSSSALPIRCNGGRELDFSRKLDNGNVTVIAVRCTDDHVTASIETFGSVPPDTDMAAPIVEAGTTEIDHALFDRVWRGAFVRADERGCRRQRIRAATTVLTLRDTQGKREVTCFDLDVTDVLDPLRAVVKVAPPAPASPDESVSWPFKGEYWRDELRYYSAR